MKHGSWDFHKQAVMAISNTADIGEMPSTQHTMEKNLNREYFVKILSTILFLAHQGLPLMRDGDEKDSKFYQLSVLRGEMILTSRI